MGETKLYNGETSENNLELYNKVRSVPTNATKPIDAGRLKGMTDINPMWRIKTLTEQFGPCGIGWYYTIDEQWTSDIYSTLKDETDKHVEELIANVRISLYIRDPNTGEWSAPIVGVGGSKVMSLESRGFYVDDDCFKKAQTDALSVACKDLGLGADWDKDSDKYIDQKKKNFNETPSTSNSNASTIDSEAKAWQDKITEYAHAHGMTVKEIGRDYKVNSKTPAARLKEVYEDLTATSTADSNASTEPPDFEQIQEQVPWKE